MVIESNLYGEEYNSRHRQPTTKKNHIVKTCKYELIQINIISKYNIAHTFNDCCGCLSTSARNTILDIVNRSLLPTPSSHARNTWTITTLKIMSKQKAHSLTDSASSTRPCIASICAFFMYAYSDSSGYFAKYSSHNFRAALMWWWAPEIQLYKYRLVYANYKHNGEEYFYNCWKKKG